MALILGCYQGGAGDTARPLLGQTSAGQSSKHVRKQEEAVLETLLHPDSPLHPTLQILASALPVHRLSPCQGCITECRGYGVRY